MSIARRIQKLEDRSIPAAQTESSRQLMEDIEAGRRRVREYYEKHGLSEPSDEGLPPRRVHTSQGIQRIIDILNEGRERSRLLGAHVEHVSNSPRRSADSGRSEEPSQVFNRSNE
jgi:hypothetical protein